MLLSALQSIVMVAKMTTVKEHVPSLQLLGNELSWTALQFAPPSFLEAKQVNTTQGSGKSRRLSEEPGSTPAPSYESLADISVFGLSGAINEFYVRHDFAEKFSS